MTRNTNTYVGRSWNSTWVLWYTGGMLKSLQVGQHQQEIQDSSGANRKWIPPLQGECKPIVVVPAVMKRNIVDKV